MKFGTLSQKYVATDARPYDEPSEYEALRMGKKWTAENDAARDLLSFIPQGARALDVPVGTGRLIPLLAERRLDAHGLDISADMLEQSRRKAAEVGANMWLGQGDIRDIPFPDDHFQLVSCLRFLNWIDEDCVEEAMAEVARVASDKLLIGVRYYAPYGEISPFSFGRRAMRLVNVPDKLAKRWGGLVYHHKDFLDRLFARLSLAVVETRHVERRWDGTDYVFYLLRKESRAH